MSQHNLRKISNSLQDVRLVSLASWRQAGEIQPRDRSGPYVVTQEGYDPKDAKMSADEFVLGRSGQWLSLDYFFRMAVPERREEFVFGTVAEVMRTLQDLPSDAVVLRPGGGAAEGPAPGESDEMAAAFKAAKDKASTPGG